MTARIAKSSLVDAGRNCWYGGTAFALSMLVFAYSARFGQLSVLCYYALWLPLCLAAPRLIFSHAERLLWTLGFAIFAWLSVFWSQAPSVTARASIQLLSHIVCALIAARVLSTRTLVLGGLAGALLVVAYSLLFGVYLYDPIDGSYTFAGAFSSKNQLGFHSSLGVFFAFCTFFLLPSVSAGHRLAALGIGLLSVYTMLASQSATSIAAIAVTLTATFAATMVLRLPTRLRKLMLIVGLVVGAVGVFAALNAGALNFVLALFGKDATLIEPDLIWTRHYRVPGGAGCRSSATRPGGCKAFPNRSGSGKSSTSPAARRLSLPQHLYRSAGRARRHRPSDAARRAARQACRPCQRAGQPRQRDLGAGHVRLRGDALWCGPSSRSTSSIPTRSARSCFTMQPACWGDACRRRRLRVSRHTRWNSDVPSAAPPADSPRRLDGIQHLRALAAIGVVLFHAAERSGLHFTIGAAGVDVFFVISGFIMWIITAGRR